MSRFLPRWETKFSAQPWFSRHLQALRNSRNQGVQVRKTGALVCALVLACGALNAKTPSKGQSNNVGSNVTSTTLNAQSMEVAREAVLPHVVSILVVREDYTAGEARLSLSGGTGTIMHPDGYIATNAHVTENGKRFRVVLNDRREFAATLVGTDPLSDLAVLKIEGGKGPFGFAKFAENLVALKPGDTVIAMGAPWGLTDSVTAGVVSNTSRLLVSLFEDEADYEQALNDSQATARYYAWIQHDASISPGNSGGPLVDLSGRIVGVNTRGNLFGGDMAFSIPAPVASQVVSALIKDGEVRRANFGFNVRSLRGTGLTAGALISTVDRDSSAQKAGLKPGDVLLAYNSVVVNLLQPENVPGFRRQLAEFAPGSSIRLQVQRNGKPLELNVLSTAQENRKAREREVSHWGMSVTEITGDLARTMYLSSRKGVLVSGMRTGGPASSAQPPLQSADRIVAVDGTNISDLDSLVLRAGSLPDAQESGKTVALSVDRKGVQLVVLLTPARKSVIAPNNPELSKAWAGFEVQPIPGTLAQQLGLPEAGFRVTRVYPGSPAEKAKLKLGDLIVATGDNPVKPSGLIETSSLDLRVRNAELSEPFAITVRRAQDKDKEKAFERLTLKLTLTDEPLSDDKSERRWYELLSLQARELTYFDRIQRELASTQQGVVIERVESGGYGGLAHLRDGDLLVKLTDLPISDLASVQAALESAQQKNLAKLSFLVMRGADTRLLYVDAPWASGKSHD